MKTCWFYLLWVILFGGCRGESRQVELKDLELRCHVTDPQENEKLVIEINGKNQVFDVPDNGVVEIKVPKIAPQYSEITYGHKFYLLYLAGGEPIAMEFSGAPSNWETKFSGNCKEINEYLSSPIAPFESSSFCKEIKEMKEETEKLLAKNIQNLESRSLPDDFTEIEKERLRYSAYGSWDTYRMNHRWMTGNENFEPSETYYATLQKLAKENTDLVNLQAYTRFVKKVVKVMAEKESSDSREDLIESEIQYIIDHYTDSLLLSDLIHHYIYDYVSSHGIGDKKELADYYKRYVKNEQMVRDFDLLCEKWGKLQPGDSSPDFNFMDSEGNFVSLHSLRGKFVYIDIWASWCGPCRREIPYLKALEEKMAGKPIAFVSISCDSDAEIWRKTLKEENMSGIQLFAGKDQEFTKAYMIKEIPRFILLDKEGRIVNVQLTAPSHPDTEAVLSRIAEQR